MTITEWEAVYHADGVVRGPFLQQFEQALRDYYANVGDTTSAGKRKTVDALDRLVSLAAKRYGIPQEEYDAIPAPWNLGDIGNDAAALLANYGETTKVIADEQHAADRAFVRTIIDDGFAQDADRRLKNSCEWILSGRHKFFVLTKTGDSAQRAGDPSKNAYFPDPYGDDGHLLGSITSYNADDLNDNTNVIERSNSTMGFANNTDKIVVVMNAQEQGEATVQETLRHELQHAADRHDLGRAEAGGNIHKDNFERYKTEYRAYNYEGGTHDQYSHTKTEKHSLDGSEEYTFTEKQWHIFKAIYDGYPHTKDGWTANAADVEGSMSFREAVVAYVNPDDKGLNKYNSIRVDDFVNALLEVPKITSDFGDPKVKALYGTIAALDASDRGAIMNESPELRSRVQQHVGGDAFKSLTSRMQVDAGRLAAFVSALEAVSTQQGDKDHPEVQAVMQAAKAFTGGEGELLQSRTPDVMELMKSKLSGPALEAVRYLLAPTAPGAD